MKVRLTDLNDQQNVGVTGPQFGQEVVEAAAVSRESVEETPGLQSAPGGQRFEYLACLLGGENPTEVRGHTLWSHSVRNKPGVIMHFWQRLLSKTESLLEEAGPPVAEKY